MSADPGGALTRVVRLQDKYDVQTGANGDVFALVLDGHGNTLTLAMLLMRN